MLHLLCALLLVGAGFGLLLLAVQLVVSIRHTRERPPEPRAFPGVSILKPLCGLDDDLAESLERFARLDYPRYELLLGVRSSRDAAYPLALAAERRHPGRVRVVVQRGEPGLNPKVNQLVSLARAARHDLLVVSDSNVVVEEGYLREIAACFEQDARVGLVTHAVAGAGEARLGSLLDNLHLSASIGPGMIGAKRVAGKDVVVGKSMALRRADLRRLGGFERVADVLAEDYVLGREIVRSLGKRVVVAHRPVWNLSRRRSVGDFYARYARWGVIHRKMVGTPVYLCELLLNPFALTLCAFALAPSARGLEGVIACALVRAAIDGAAGGSLRGHRFRVHHLAAVPLKDVVLAAAWLQGLLRSSVEWRSNRLTVLDGTRLARPTAAPEPQLLQDVA
jgi:ceramide glucosyltransferase